MTRIPSLLLLLLVVAAPAVAAELNVVTTTQDLAAIAREVGGTRVDVAAIAWGDQDPHFVEPKPSHLLTLRRADLLIAVGRELESGWLPSLVSGSRNPKLLQAGGGYLDASLGCRVLEKPEGRVDRSMGDVHPEGNPHYWLDPNNGRLIARSIAERLSMLDPPGRDHYQASLANFEKRLDDKIPGWKARAKSWTGSPVVPYHNSWPNLLEFLELEAAIFIEPKPGIPPSPSHTLEVIRRIEADSIRVILLEPYFDHKTPDEIARRTGAKVVVLYPSVGGRDDIQTYFDLFDVNLEILAEALR